MTDGGSDDLRRAGCGADTCEPTDRADWHPGNPARGQSGQCGVTAGRAW
jgi:hypothetical protein